MASVVVVVVVGGGVVVVVVVVVVGVVVVGVVVVGLGFGVVVRNVGGFVTENVEEMYVICNEGDCY